MKQHINKLLAIGGESLIDCPPSFDRNILELAGTLKKEFHQLLSVKNGFYCFESALHVFPSGHFRNTKKINFIFN